MRPYPHRLDLILLTSIIAGTTAVPSHADTSQIACAPIKDSPAKGCLELSTAEFERVVSDGETVVHSGTAKPWPDSTLYAYLDASPDEAAALFVDYEAGKKFTDSMLEAIVFECDVPKARRRCVYYSLSVPVISDESYTLTDDLYPYHDGTGHMIIWNHINPGRSKAFTGSVRFEALGGIKGGTLMLYYNHVTPSTAIGKIPGLAGKALKQGMDFVTAFREGLMDEKAAKDQRPLRDHLAALKAMAAEGTKKK